MMQAFLAAAAEVEARQLAPEMSDRDREEGRVYVAGLVRWQLNRALVASDPQRPCFATCMDTFSKWGLETPDNLYRSARISGDAEYLISGRRGTCADLAVEVLTGLAGDDGTTGEGISVIDADALRVEPDGTYRIQVGGERREHNYLSTGPEANEVFLRHSLGDWDEQVGDVAIERMTAESDRGPSVTERLDRAATLLLRSAEFNSGFADGWRASIPLNSVTPPSGGKGGGFLPGQRNAVGRWQVPSDQALIVSIEPVECRIMSVAIGHDRWFTSFDYRNHLCHRSQAQARSSSDGRYHYVISSVDPEVPNWVDTVGHDRGFIFLRWQGMSGEDPPIPDFKLVAAASIAEHLPAGEPRVSADGRAAELAARRDSLDRRFF